MYYKVIKDNRVIDVLDCLIYVKWQKENEIMVFSEENEAQAIVSSDGKTIWHVKGFYEVPVDGYDTVRIEEIDEYEYKQLKVLNGKTPEQIIDEYNLMLLQGGII